MESRRERGKRKGKEEKDGGRENRIGKGKE